MHPLVYLYLLRYAELPKSPLCGMFVCELSNDTENLINDFSAFCAGQVCLCLWGGSLFDFIAFVCAFHNSALLVWY